ncbi:retrovirus-related Pol polyprotein from transposon 297 [Trichonephila clavata]|uniref:Retrovirus-related Pol polyprotein from transposon 297 n=1 Tax=Trichonephila clavata TaxID=2740835 RepID=A0A8X6HWU8_TRICU|nr:retrovirus-related Pol polyprotein from transposon 297 [Trichonephila clavata]
MKHEMSDGYKRPENFLMMSPELNEEQNNQLAELLRTFSGIFKKTDKSVTAHKNMKHRIHIGNHASINQMAYQISPTERRTLRNEMQKILENGL